MTEPLPAPLPIASEVLSATDRLENFNEHDISPLDEQDEEVNSCASSELKLSKEIRSTVSSETLEQLDSMILDTGLYESGAFAAVSSTQPSYMDHVHKVDVEDNYDIEMTERLVVFMGRSGVGKTSLYGCYQGRENLQKLQLASHTKDIKAAFFANTYTVNGKKITVGFKCYDTEGFTGNQKVDLVLLNNLVEAIRLNVPKIHVIFFCLTAVRFSNDDENVLKLIRNHGGQDLINRLKFVVTNAPEKLVSAELRLETQTKLSEVTGRTITADDIIYSNLIDPNQFDADTELYRATKRYWLQNKLRLQRLTRDIPDESSFHINRISGTRKVLSLLQVYSKDIAIVVFSIVICLLLTGLVMSRLRNDELLRRNDQLRLEIEKARSTEEVSLPEAFAEAVVGQVGKVLQGGMALVKLPYVWMKSSHSTK